MHLIDQLIRIVINSFILIMIFWMVFWDSEQSNPIKKYWVPKMKPIFLWLGLTAEWKMFSPDPFLYNSWPNLKIFLNDGEFILWEPTQGNDLNIIQKARYKKSQKFYHEVGRAKASFHTKIDFIEYLLDKYNLNEKYTKVEIYRIHQNIIPYENQLSESPKIYKQLIYTHYPNN